MKIIGVDNYDRENVSDILIAESIENEKYAADMVDVLNTKYCKTGYSTTYFRAVPDDYKLYRYQP